MQVLRSGSIGAEVLKWQHFLVGLDHYKGEVDNTFGPKTEAATREFQRDNHLTADGFVGRETWSKAFALGFGEVYDDGELGSNWPPRPDGLASPSQADRERMFGRFKYKMAPTSTNRERIEVLDNWVSKNLLEVHVPQLRNINGAPKDCKIWMHRLLASKIQKLFATWEKEGLLPLILTFDGTYASRCIRGSTKTLSAHSHGSAFDINAQWNRIGSNSALVGEKGSVRKLVPVANDQGWFWGGHYKSRSDGMHFECARL